MLGLLSNENLDRGVNWTLLSDSLFAEFDRITETTRLAPLSCSLSALRNYWHVIRKARRATALLSMNGRAMPDWRLEAVSLAAGRKTRVVFYVDPWRHSLTKIRNVDRLFGHDLAFIPYREAYDALVSGKGHARYRHLPFAADTRVFKDHGLDRDIDILWMGRRYEPLHRAILDYARPRGLRYVYRETMGFILDPNEMGRFASRARYFVATPPDLDDPVRTGGFSPLVMRYFEGPAAGCRLLGVLPRSGEFVAVLPRESILEVAPDGSDFAARFEADRLDTSGWDAAAEASRTVRRDHGWDSRARAIRDEIAMLGGVRR
jgi:hypothetical protein